MFAVQQVIIDRRDDKAGRRLASGNRHAGLHTSFSRVRDRQLYHQFRSKIGVAASHPTQRNTAILTDGTVIEAERQGLVDIGYLNGEGAIDK